LGSGLFDCRPVIFRIDFYPVEEAVSPQDLVTTIYHGLGIATDTELADPLGRPVRLCQGEVIQGVLA
jgi:hypothetical protein